MVPLDLADIKGKEPELEDATAAEQAVKFARKEVGLHPFECAAQFGEFGHFLGAVVDHKILEVILLLLVELWLPGTRVVD